MSLTLALVIRGRLVLVYTPLILIFVPFSSQDEIHLYQKLTGMQHFLWQHVYEDYYSTHGRGFVDSKPVRLEHASKLFLSWITTSKVSWEILTDLDHCADLLRQKLMCDADVGLIPMYWVKHHDHPWPDFSTVHQCRNFDAVLAWVKEHQVQLPNDITITRPDDVVNLEMPP